MGQEEASGVRKCHRKGGRMVGWGCTSVWRRVGIALAMRISTGTEESLVTAGRREITGSVVTGGDALR